MKGLKATVLKKFIHSFSLQLKMKESFGGNSSQQVFCSTPSCLSLLPKVKTQLFD